MTSDAPPAERAESSETPHPDSSASSQEAALRDGLRKALIERGISNPDEETLRMLLYAARLAPVNQPLISVTRLFLAAKETGHLSARSDSYLAALPRVIAKNWQDDYDAARASYPSELEPIEQALSRLRGKWFTEGAAKVLSAARSQPANLPVSDAIVLAILKSDHELFNKRFPNLAKLAAEVEAFRTSTPTNVWLLFSTEKQTTASWVNDLAPGRLLFWRHNSVAYTRRMRVGDSVVVMIGSADRGGRIVATGLLAADASVVFRDTRQDARRYPVLCLDAFQTKPIDRRELERAIGEKLVSQKGAVHPVSKEALAEINKALGRSGISRTLPVGVTAANAAFASGENIQSALKQHSYIVPEGAQLPPWPPHIPPPAESRPTETAPNAARSVGQAENDAYVPFNTDAPSVVDTLERAPLALFLARRLHLIWCDLNGCAPEVDQLVQKGGQSHVDQKETAGGPLGRLGVRLRQACSELYGRLSDFGRAKETRSDIRGRRKQLNEVDEAETFIVHIDSPWGGGKTTFASFVARILNPEAEILDEDHFLRAVLAPSGASRQELKSIKLQEIFLDPSHDNRTSRWSPRGRQPWIIVKYNAWQEQYVQPPWWHIFLKIQAGLNAALRAQRKGKGPLDWGWWTSIWHGICIKALRLFYQLWNSKIRVQAGIIALAVVLGFLIYKSEIIGTWLAPSPNDKRSFDFYAGLLAFLGLSVPTILSLISQSFTPELEFTAEHKQIGVTNPIGRFQRAFARMLKRIDRPVLLIVDDIDRCEPRNVVEILRGFQTIIRSPRLFVLVLGDRSWIEKAHEVYHRDFTGLSVGPEAKLGERFVEKIFQLSFRLPAMTPEEREEYTKNVVRRGTTRNGPIERDAGSSSAAPPATSEVGLSGSSGTSGSSLGDGSASTSPDAHREIYRRIDEIASSALPIQQREAQLNDVKAVAAKLGIDNSSEVEKLAAVKLVAAAGSNRAYQQELTNALIALAARLPNNPRQIKRIFNAFAVYDGVGRILFLYRTSSDGSDEQDLRARRWWQLAKWVVLATEWPMSWRAVAREPRLLDAAYLEDQEERDAVMKAILAELSEDEKKDANAARQRLIQSASLRRLLSHPDAQKWNSSRPQEEFTDFGLEMEAIYEFNRILWEPGFPVTQPEPDQPSEAAVAVKT